MTACIRFSLIGMQAGNSLIVCRRISDSALLPCKSWQTKVSQRLYKNLLITCRTNSVGIEQCGLRIIVNDSFTLVKEIRFYSHYILANFVHTGYHLNKKRAINV